MVSGATGAKSGAAVVKSGAAVVKSGATGAKSGATAAAAAGTPVEAFPPRCAAAACPAILPWRRGPGGVTGRGGWGGVGRYVVDTGRAKEKVYCPKTGVGRFKIAWVSQASTPPPPPA